MKILFINIIISIIILLIPLFIKITIFFDKDLKKLYFSINLFKTILILGGYIEIFETNLAIHISKRKAILIPFFKKMDFKKQFELFKGYKITKLDNLIEIGNENDLVFPFMFSGFSKIISDITSSLVTFKKRELRIKNNFLVIEGENVFKFSGSINIQFNLLLIFITINKIIVRKIINE